jgi:hypothetical protein
MRRSPPVRSAIAPILGLALIGGGCSLLDTLTQATPSLSIQEFTASPEILEPGGESVVTWTVTGADLVEIDHGVGPVRGEGTLRVRPAETTTYTLVAIAGANQATASIQVVVAGADPTPTPEPTPEASPTPTPTPEPASCGTLTSAPGGCALLVTRHQPLPEGQCLELNEVAVDTACPVNDGSRRVISFTVTASTPHAFLRWRQASGSADALLPSEGFVAGDDVSTVLLNDTVREPSLSIELLDPGDQRLLSFTLRHR